MMVHILIGMCGCLPECVRESVTLGFEARRKDLTHVETLRVCSARL